MMEKLKGFFGKIKAFLFRRKKRFYIILTVIFSLVLLLDLLIAALVPSQNTFGQMGMTADISQMDLSDLDVSDFTGADTDSDSSDSSSSDGDSDSDASSDSSGMPDMSEMPSGGGMRGSSDSSDSDSDSDSDFDTSDSDGTVTASVSTGNGFGVLRVLQGIKSHWVLIAVLAALLDAGSITMLVLIRRREKKAAALEEQRQREAMLEDGEVHLARPAKKGKKTSAKTWAVFTAVVLVLVIVVVNVLQGMLNTTETAETSATVYTETASLGDISTTLPGAGTLTEEDAVEVSLPSEVTITEWYVSNGDSVEVGDTLAKVDTASALTAIATVQETLDSLDEALADAEDTETTGTVTAAASGRVKAIYAAEDTTVIDTMYESGSLLLLSLDGLMAVAFETESEVTVGDSVTVTLSDGTEETGTVESTTGGTIVVTLTDDGTTLGDSVTVTNSDGTVIGSGELYIHSELKVMAFSGTVSSVSVSVEESVSSGDTLLSLTDIDNTLEVQLLVEQRTVLEEQMETLFALYQEGYLYAETAGIVSGLTSSTSSSSDDDSDSSSDTSDSTSDTSDSSSDSSADAADSDSDSVDGTSTSGLGSSLVDLLQSAFASGSSVLTVSAETESDDESEVSLATETTETTAATDSTDSSEEEDSTDSSYANYIGIVTDVNDGTVTVTLYSITGSLSTTAVAGTFTLTDTTVYTWSDGALSVTDGSDLAAGDSLILLCSADADTADLAPICVICVAASGSTETDADSSDTAADSTDSTDSSSDSSTDSTDSSSDSSADSTGSEAYGSEEGSTDDQSQSEQSDASGTGQDASAMADGTDTSGTSIDADTLASALESLTGSSDTEDASSVDASDLASALSEATGTEVTEAEASTSAALAESVSTSYTVSETTQCSITPQDYVYITITIDELDILSLAVGQEAAVTLDAFPGQSFTGEVESIDLSGTNSGGNSKYTAVIRVDREEDMLAGMNASVKITLDTTENVLCIPAEALVEDETGVYVYTSYNEKTDTLGDLVEVMTGISDGTTVEILSGLEEGDTYYYSVLDTVNYSTSTNSVGGSLFSFGGR